MNKKWLSCTVMMVGLVLPARAALEFTNVTGVIGLHPGGIATLNGVAYDGDDTFVAVGENSTVLAAEFGSSLPWVSNAVPTSALNLKSVAHGNDRFAAGGLNVVFSSTNAGTWTQTSNSPFILPVNVQGLAYNSNTNRFAAVSSFINISRADSVFAAWTPATSITNSILIESFRGVTALPGNGFAACGLRGDIRISLDGAETWSDSRPFTASEPDLFGIASGGGRIMAVGSAGRVMVSTNSGLNWSTNSTPIGSTNNAVAYTGTEFIVAGNDGRILAGTNVNAADWATNASFGANLNLRGVSFATSGKMQGVAVVVGDDGTVILGGTRPPEFSNLTNQTVCSGSGNTNLSVNLNTNGFPIGVLVVEWVNGNGQLVASNLAASVNYLAATNTIPGGGNNPSNFVYSVRARDLRTGFVNTNNAQVTLTINPRPTATTSVTGPNPICSGSETEVRVVLTGLGPWTFTWLSNGIPLITNTCLPSRSNTLPITPLNPSLSLASDAVYAVTNLSDCTTGCVADTSTDLTNNSVVTIFPPVTVNAGLDQTVCSSSPNVTLAGSVTGGATTGTWSGGAGTFNPNATTLAATYTPSAGEITAGTVTLTLTSADPAGPCPAVADTMTITINPAAVVNAGLDQTVCSSSPNVVLAGSVTGGATTGTWSGGAGTFNPNATTLAATYTPSAGEITAGTVTLTLTSADPAGPCPAVVDTMTITINPAAVVNAGLDQTVCSSSPNVVLAGSVTGGATTGTWSGGAGTFNPGTTTLTATYTPSADEITAGTVTLTLTSADPAGPCPAVADTMTITINPLPGATNLMAGATSSVPLSIALQPAVTNGVFSIFSWVATNNLNVSGESTNPVINSAITNTLVNVTPNQQTVFYTVTPTSTNGCSGSIFTVSVTLNPQPAGTNAVKTICSRDSVAQALQPLITNNVISTFSWLATTPSAGVEGESLTSVNTGVITDNLTNGTPNPLNVIYTVIPTSTNGFTGSSFTVTVTVNPEPTVATVNNQSQVLCSGDLIAPVTFTGASYFEWTNNTPAYLQGTNSGRGAINNLTGINNTPFPVTNWITVTPFYTNGNTGGPTCPGATTNVIILVNPLPGITNVNPQTQTQTIADDPMTDAINLAGTFTEIAWTNDNPTITSIPASGRLPALGQPALEGMTQLDSFTMVSTGIVNITFTPYYSNSVAGGKRCQGASVTATVTRGIPINPYLVIQSLDSTNVVLEWIAYTNTSLLSATNLSSPNWTGVTNSVTTNGPTNQVIIPLPGSVPYRFFRLTNGP